MFPRRQKVIDGSIVTDTPINDLVYAETHGVFGANTLPFVFELVRLVKPATCVVIGSGDGLIPRVIREAQIISKAENGRVFLIDLGKSMGALPEKIHDQDSLFRKIYPEIIVFKGKASPMA